MHIARICGRKTCARSVCECDRGRYRPNSQTNRMPAALKRRSVRYRRKPRQIRATAGTLCDRDVGLCGRRSTENPTPTSAKERAERRSGPTEGRKREAKSESARRIFEIFQAFGRKGKKNR